MVNVCSEREELVGRFALELLWEFLRSLTLSTDSAKATQTALR